MPTTQFSLLELPKDSVCLLAYYTNASRMSSGKNLFRWIEKADRGKLSAKKGAH
jgi:hypothetical protein